MKARARRRRAAQPFVVNRLEAALEPCPQDLFRFQEITGVFGGQRAMTPPRAPLP
jgi:hypothetical protein